VAACIVARNDDDVSVLMGYSDDDFGRTALGVLRVKQSQSLNVFLPLHVREWFIPIRCYLLRRKEEETWVCIAITLIVFSNTRKY
jgi:hypothetical protein